MDRHEMLTDKLEIHLSELPKLAKGYQDRQRPLWNWLAFLRGAPQTERSILLRMKQNYDR